MKIDIHGLGVIVIVLSIALMASLITLAVVTVVALF